jgi:FtsP/CotA-like multicopper oxidase with cupredoxin domain
LQRLSGAITVKCQLIRGGTIRKILSPLSRRRLLAGAAAIFAAPSALRGQAASPSGDVRVLRAEPAGYDGIVPGPMLRVTRGEEVHVRLVNALSEPTALHWHGVRLANAMDGVPPLTQPPVAPGESFDYRFTAPDAGTYWYHPPRLAPRGRYGVLIVNETEPVDVDHDYALVFDDARADAAADSAPFTVNGTSSFDIRAGQNERLRLRLLNASGNRVLNLRIAGLRSFVMATDGEPAPPFAAREGRLSLGPGNRIDLFVDCTLAPGSSAPIALEHPGAGAIPIARIACEAGAPARPAPRDQPRPLPPNALPERMDFAAAFHLDTVAGRNGGQGGGQNSQPLFTVARGRTVMLGLSNLTSETVAMHLHGHSFRLLDNLDDGWKPFWLDTMPIEPQTKPRIAFVADNPGKWLIEGLAADGSPGVWFEVT